MNYIILSKPQKHDVLSYISFHHEQHVAYNAMLIFHSRNSEPAFIKYSRLYTYFKSNWFLPCFSCGNTTKERRLTSELDTVPQLLGSVLLRMKRRSSAWVPTVQSSCGKSPAAPSAHANFITKNFAKQNQHQYQLYTYLDLYTMFVTVLLNFVGSF